MSKTKSVSALLISFVVILALGYMTAFGFGEKKIGSARDINLGLDLAGGVSVTYQAKADGKNEINSENMKDTIYQLQKRAETKSTEAQVYQEGSDRITIEIPGATDKEATLKELGKPGSLEFVAPGSSSGDAGQTVLTGSDIEDAQPGITEKETGQKSYVVNLTLTSEGAKKFEDATSKNIGKNIAIMYDEKQISNPEVQNTISGGKAEISGMADYDEADELASMIRIGALKLELDELRSNVVGATLGAQALKTSLIAGAIGVGIIMVFMIVFFLIPGLASAIALLGYTILMLVTLNAFDVTLTLPGIAGIVLSIGMAVDANVIIFARIREEIGAGKSVKTAIKTGFSKAMSAIVDGNVTTLIAAIVLGLKGSGSVKGFAQTLAIGIVLSMISALFVTRMLLNAFYSLGIKDEKYYGKQKARKLLTVVQKRTVCFIISGVIIVAGFAVMAVNHFGDKGALKYSLEFMSGTSTNVSFKEDMTIDELEKKVLPVVSEVTGDKNIQMQKVNDDGEADKNRVIIKTKELDLDKRSELNSKLVEKFDVDKEKIETESISATVSNEMRRDAVVAVVIATICMLFYIWFRFKDIRFASSAVLALIHDVLVVLAFYAISRISVGNTFIACMLTIVGYSINATIVIFDRIRENMKGNASKAELDKLVNQSITDTMTRSIYSSLTTFITVFVLFLMGVSSIKEFAAPLMVGIVAGCYSSICMTGTIWYLMKRKRGTKAAKELSN